MKLETYRDFKFSKRNNQPDKLIILMLWQPKMRTGSIHIDLWRTVERGGKNKVWLRALIGN